MYFATILATAFLAVASAQVVENPKDAAAIYDNPVGKQYSAIFDGSKGVTGSLTFVAGAGGSGVDVVVKLSGFVGEIGPFGYHVHDQPVPADGNCTGTKAHLDPYGRGQTPPCDNTKPETCEVGDLSGKWGRVPAASSGPIEYAQSYNDLYISTKDGIGAFIGNRSIVIHRGDENKTRLACVNVVLHESTYPSAPVPTSTGIPYNPGNNTTNGTAPPPSPSETYTGSAASFGISSLAAIGGLVAGFMMAL